MPFIIKYTFLYALCFYYAILTPKFADYENDLGNFVFEVVLMSVVQAFVFAGLITWVEIDGVIRHWVEGLTGHFPALWELGAFVGAWTLLGGLQYPCLDHSLKQEKAKRNYKSPGQQAMEEVEAEERQKAEQERLEAEKTWQLVLSRGGSEVGLNYLRLCKQQIDSGLPPLGCFHLEGHLPLVKDPQWLAAEIRRLDKVVKAA